MTIRFRSVGCVILQLIGIVFFVCGMYELPLFYGRVAIARTVMLGGAFFLLYSGSFLRCVGRPRGYVFRVMNNTFGVLFVLYLLMVLELTLFDNGFGRGGNALWFITGEAWQANLAERTNWIPFYTVAQFLTALRHGVLTAASVAANLLGNLALFMPFALFLPILMKPMRQFACFALSVGSTVLLIEGLQLLLGTGSCDIDDFLLNVGGACLAYRLFSTRLISRGLSWLTLGVWRGK